MSIYTPKTIEEAKELSALFSNCARLSAQEVLLLHAVYGHHYGGNMGLTMTQAYCLKGKPALNADAMAGIVRKSGLCKYIKIVEWTNELCTIAMSRNDEDFEHTYTFTKKMAELQGLLRNNNWKTMPMQMLRARCLTMGLRATFPESVSGIYSADEMVDNMEMSDDERLEIVAESLGEEVKKNTRAQFIEHLNKPSAPPTPAPAPAPAPVKAEPPAPQNNKGVNPAGHRLTNYEDWSYFVKAHGNNPKMVKESLDFKGLNPQEMDEEETYLNCTGVLAVRGYTFKSREDVDSLELKQVEELLGKFDEFYTEDFKLPVFNNDLYETLWAYVESYKPWFAELLKLYKAHHENLKGRSKSKVKKDILECSSWEDYRKVKMYILERLS